MTEYFGQNTAQASNSTLNATVAAFQSLIGRIQTMSVVQVIACTNNGGVSPVGTVDVQIMVGQVDGIGNVTPHGTIFSLPYFRLQGGTNAIIIDPAPGDIGAAGFCSRDISAVKASRKIGAPGSKRRFAASDGLYFGGFLSLAPVQYIQFNQSGITVYSPNAITVTAPHVTVNASTQATIVSPDIEINASSQAVITAPTITLNGAVAATGTLTSNGHDISSTHRHSSSGGTGTGGPPL